MDTPIEQLQRLGDLPEGWDDEGASVISTRAVAASADLLTWLSELRLGCPVIGPCADGSVDLHWRSTDMQLLVNLSDSGYGDFFLKTPRMEAKGHIEIW